MEQVGVEQEQNPLHEALAEKTDKLGALRVNRLFQVAPH
jgi:hypothetical protein